MDLLWGSIQGEIATKKKIMENSKIWYRVKTFKIKKQENKKY